MHYSDVTRTVAIPQMLQLCVEIPFRQDVLRKTQSSVIRTSVDLKQKRELEMSQPQNSQKYDTWKGNVTQYHVNISKWLRFFRANFAYIAITS